MEVKCTNCQQGDRTNPCKSCGAPYCERCALGPECDASCRQSEPWVFGFPSVSVPVSASPRFEYTEEEERAALRAARGIRSESKARRVEPGDEERKRKRGEELEPSAFRLSEGKRPAVRSGIHSGAGIAMTTLRQVDQELGVATWNINHFNKAAYKKEIILWLFEAHSWLDVLVLQEVNLSGRKHLEALVSDLSDLGVICHFGPLIRSLSATQKPKHPEEAQSFEQEVEGGKIWVRPGQQEFYPILYRVKSISCKKVWAIHGGAKREVEGEKPLWWSKKPYLHRLFKVDDLDGEIASDLCKHKVHKILRKAFKEAPLKPVGKINFLRRSSSRKKAWETKWRLVDSDEREFVIYGSGKEITAHCAKEIVPEVCRPVIVYDLNRGGELIRVGVVHTTPEGSGLRRKGEFSQVEPTFKIAAVDEVPWVVAGDYYLDPESTVEDSEELRAMSLFRAAISEHGLAFAISISGTNQSRVRQYSEDKMKDQVVRIIEENEEQIQIRVVNKRADFMVCSSVFKNRFAGLFRPSGGLMRVDPGHKALNWWSEISDHCPMGAILSTSDFSRKRFAHNVQTEDTEYERRLEKAYQQIRELHRQAALGLASCLRKLVGLCASSRVRLESTRLRAEGLGEVKLSVLVMKACLMLDCILNDPYVQQFDPLGAIFDRASWQLASGGFTMDSLGGYLEALQKPMDKEAEASEELKEALYLLRDARKNLQALDYVVGDLDLEPEDRVYGDELGVD